MGSRLQRIVFWGTFDKEKAIRGSLYWVGLCIGVLALGYFFNAVLQQFSFLPPVHWRPGSYSSLTISTLLNIHVVLFGGYCLFIYTYGTSGLYPLRIDQVKALLLDCDFEIIDIYTRMSTINTTRLPGILKDLATWHVCYLARKPL